MWDLCTVALHVVFHAWDWISVEDCPDQNGPRTRCVGGFCLVPPWYKIECRWNTRTWKCWGDRLNDYTVDCCKTCVKHTCYIEYTLDGPSEIVVFGVAALLGLGVYVLKRRLQESDEAA